MENSINIEICNNAIGIIYEDLNTMNNIIDALGECSVKIKHSWNSDNSDVFQQKVDNIIENLYALKEFINNINTAVEKTKNDIVTVDASAAGEQ